MNIKSLIASAISFFALSGVGIDTLSNNYLAYIHYLIGSGQPITTTSPDVVAKLRGMCEDPKRVTHRKVDRWVVNGYGADEATSYTFGSFTCIRSGQVYDHYDFSVQVATNPKLGDIQRCLKKQTPRAQATCLVKSGFGKPYDIKLDVGPITPP